MADNYEDKVEPTAAIDSSSNYSETPPVTGLINVSGHKQELERNFGLISLCGLGITSGNTWIALGGSVVRSFEPVASAVLIENSCRRSQYIMVVYLALFMSSSQLHSSTGSLQPQSLSSHQRCQQRVEVRSRALPKLCCKIIAEFLKQYIIGRQSLLVDMDDHVDGLLAGGTAWHGSSDSPQPARLSPLK